MILSSHVLIWLLFLLTLSNLATVEGGLIKKDFGLKSSENNLKRSILNFFKRCEDHIQTATAATTNATVQAGVTTDTCTGVNCSPSYPYPSTTGQSESTLSGSLNPGMNGQQQQGVNTQVGLNTGLNATLNADLNTGLNTGLNAGVCTGTQCQPSTSPSQSQTSTIQSSTIPNTCSGIQCQTVGSEVSGVQKPAQTTETSSASQPQSGLGVNITGGQSTILPAQTGLNTGNTCTGNNCGQIAAGQPSTTTTTTTLTCTGTNCPANGVGGQVTEGGNNVNSSSDSLSQSGPGETGTVYSATAACANGICSKNSSQAIGPVVQVQAQSCAPNNCTNPNGNYQPGQGYTQLGTGTSGSTSGASASTGLNVGAGLPGGVGLNASIATGSQNTNEPIQTPNSAQIGQPSSGSSTVGGETGLNVGVGSGITPVQSTTSYQQDQKGQISTGGSTAGGGVGLNAGVGVGTIPVQNTIPNQQGGSVGLNAGVGIGTTPAQSSTSYQQGQNGQIPTEGSSLGGGSGIGINATVGAGSIPVQGSNSYQQQTQSTQTPSEGTGRGGSLNSSINAGVESGNEQSTVPVQIPNSSQQGQTGQVSNGGGTVGAGAGVGLNTGVGVGTTPVQSSISTQIQSQPVQVTPGSSSIGTGLNSSVNAGTGLNAGVSTGVEGGSEQSTIPAESPNTGQTGQISPGTGVGVGFNAGVNAGVGAGTQTSTIPVQNTQPSQTSSVSTINSSSTGGSGGNLGAGVTADTEIGSGGSIPIQNNQPAQSSTEVQSSTTPTNGTGREVVIGQNDHFAIGGQTVTSQTSTSSTNGMTAPIYNPNAKTACTYNSQGWLTECSVNNCPVQIKIPANGSTGSQTNEGQTSCSPNGSSSGNFFNEIGCDVLCFFGTNCTQKLQSCPCKSSNGFNIIVKAIQCATIPFLSGGNNG